MRVHQQPIPCRLREATFVLDGLLEHETELDPRTVYTHTHGYTEVVMATAALLGKSLAPRIAHMHEQTLYKLDPSRHYAQLDPILDGTVKPRLVRRAWDETVLVVASIPRPNRVTFLDPASAGAVRAPAQPAPSPERDVARAARPP